MRLAFLTPEFVTEVEDAGGLATYLERMSRALREAGHEAEVFTLSAHPPAVLDHGGIRVERVRRRRPWWGLLPRQTLRLLRLWRLEAHAGPAVARPPCMMRW